MADHAAPPRQRFADLLVAHWYRPRRSWLSRSLLPLAWAYGALQRASRRRAEQRSERAGTMPTVVVGNLVAGGAGKTPVVIALAEVLRAAGWTPGVVSRGYGRRSSQVMPVTADTPASQCGDEPLLLHRRTGVPVWVGQQRLPAAAALRAAHPEVDLLLCDDALQHRVLQRDVEIVVFDERGIGNGWLLPAGPLREPMPAQPPPGTFVLYNHTHATTRWPGDTLERVLGDAVPLAAWRRGSREGARPLAALRGGSLAALAGIAVPERFFGMLRAAGLEFTSLPMPDHHPYAEPPRWPDGVGDVLTTEKDAVKLADPGGCGPRLWVVPLDLRLPPGFVAALLARLPAPPANPSPAISRPAAAPVP